MHRLLETQQISLFRNKIITWFEVYFKHALL